MIIANEDVREVTTEIPAGHHHLQNNHHSPGWEGVYLSGGHDSKSCQDIYFR